MDVQDMFYMLCRYFCLANVCRQCLSILVLYLIVAVTRCVLPKMQDAYPFLHLALRQYCQQSMHGNGDVCCSFSNKMNNLV